jgi:glucokinase
MEYCVGIDLGGTAVKIGIINKDGEIKDSLQVPTLAETNQADVIVNNLINAVKELLSKHSSIHVKGIGIGVPGFVNPDLGVVTDMPNIPAFQEYFLVKEIKKHLKYPVFVDNDANNAARGEYLFGAGKGSKNLVIITLGTGIGGGVFTNGELYGGAINYAGEVGHMVLVPDGKPCGCGNYGCWEAYSSAPSMVRYARLLIEKGYSTGLKKYYPEKLDSKVITELAKEGDPAAELVFDTAARYSGLAIGNLINIFNPSSVIIGGGVSHAGKFLLDKLDKYAQIYALPKAWKSVKIIPAKLGNSAGIQGSAALAFMKADK